MSKMFAKFEAPQRFLTVVDGQLVTAHLSKNGEMKNISICGKPHSLLLVKNGRPFANMTIWDEAQKKLFSARGSAKNIVIREFLTTGDFVHGYAVIDFEIPNLEVNELPVSGGLNNVKLQTRVDLNEALHWKEFLPSEMGGKINSLIKEAEEKIEAAQKARPQVIVPNKDNFKLAGTSMSRQQRKWLRRFAELGKAEDQAFETLKELFPQFAWGILSTQELQDLLLEQEV